MPQNQLTRSFLKNAAANRHTGAPGRSTLHIVSFVMAIVLSAGGHFKGHAQIVSSSYTTSFFVKKDSTFWAAGYNEEGYFGDGTTTNSSTPRLVAGVNGVISIARGQGFTLLLKANGTVMSFGYNSQGMLGRPVSQSYIPTVIPGLTNVVAIAAGRFHSLFLKSDGTVWGCGSNAWAQLGMSTATSEYFSVVQLPGLSNIVAIAGGFDHSLFVKSNGTVMACGWNNHGQLGDNTTTPRESPVQVIGLTGVTKVAAGFYFSLFQKSDGTVRACGSNSSGQLGDGTTTERITTVAVSGLTDVAELSTTFLASSALYLRNDKTAWACGSNSSGQLGDGTTVNRTTVVKVSGLTGISAISMGSSHALFVKNNGTYWASGNNSYGQLGTGNTTNTTVPVMLTTIVNIHAPKAWYSQNSGNANDATNWNQAVNGSDTMANFGDFTAAGNTWNMRHSMTLGSAMALATGSSVVVGDNGIPCNFTIPSSFAYTGMVSVTTGSLTTSNTTAFTLGSIGSNTTVTYNAASTQNIAGGTYSNLVVGTGSNTVTYTATGNLTVDGNLTVNPNATLNLGTNMLSGLLNASSGSGIISTSNTSTTPIPAGRTWDGTVKYSTAGQTIAYGTYNNLAIAGSSGTWSATNTVEVTGTLTIPSNTTLNMSTYILSGALTTVSVSGTVRTANTTSAPIPAGKTWGGRVAFTAAAVAKPYPQVFIPIWILPEHRAPGLPAEISL